MSNGYLTGCALIISAIISIILITKNTINNIETKIFKKMLLFNVFESLTTTSIVIVALTSNSIPVFKILNRIDTNLIIWWCSGLLLYIAHVCKVKQRKAINYSLLGINGICFILSLILDVTIIAQDGILDCSGPLPSLALIGAVMYMIYMIIIVLTCLKNKPDVKKLIPFFILIFLLVLLAVLRTIVPQINFVSIMFTIIDLIMVFTIENPDLKMLNEYVKNKELVEIGIQEKTNLLFKITQEVKNPINKISLLSSSSTKLDDIEKMRENYIRINEISNNVIKSIDNILDISEMDKKNLKIIDSTYNIYNLFSQIIYLVKEKTYSDSQVEFKYNISNATPTILHGDSSRLKQIICSIIFNAYRNTEKGVIDFDISSIVKYDICRLVITISDTGRGMKLDVINDILENEKEISEEDINKLTSLDIDLKLIKKIVEIQGGSLLINSDENGSVFTVVLDQEIEQEEKSDYINEMAKNISNKKRALLIDDDYKELELISHELKTNGLDVIETMYGKDCIDRIQNNETYDYVFIDDDMEKYNAVTTIQELKKLNVKLPKIIVMLSPSSVQIKEHFLQDYPFDDYMIKEEYQQEIERIVLNKKNQ